MRLSVTTFRRGRVPLVLALTLSLASCLNSDTIFHGATFTRNGEMLTMASLMPSCACATISSNRSKHPGDDIQLVARLHGIEVGQTVLRPKAPIRFQFDWAGLSNADVYEVSAYTLNKGQRGQQLVPLKDHIALESEVVQTPCGSNSCSFGPLHLNLAWAEQQGQGAADTYDVGVTMINGGLSLVANTIPGMCGCMLLRNTTDTPVQLRSRLHGHERGQLVFPPREVMTIGFDFAGDNPDDAYVIEGTLTPIPKGPDSKGELDISSAPALLTLSEYLVLVAEFRGVECSHGADAVRVEVNGTAAMCPFGALNMNEKVGGSPAAKKDRP